MLHIKVSTTVGMYKGDNERQGDYEKLAAVWTNIWTEEKPTTDT